MATATETIRITRDDVYTLVVAYAQPKSMVARGINIPELLDRAHHRLEGVKSGMVPLIARSRVVAEHGPSVMGDIWAELADCFEGRDIADVETYPATLMVAADRYVAWLNCEAA